MNELDIIIKVINVLSKNAKCKSRYAFEIDNFQNRKRQAELNKYRLGVIGVTSSGKSTMINSLLGETLLPAVARPSSSQLVSCFHANVRIAKVYFQDGRTKSYSGASLNQKLLEKYADEGTNSKNKEKVKQIELSTTEVPFDDDIILIDSPGLDAYGYAGHEQLTMNSLLPTIDFCIFVTTCKTNSDDKMRSVLDTVAEYEKPVIIVQNMIDSLKPSLDGKKSIADVAQDHRVRIERIINNSKIKDKSKVHIVQISAIYALNARLNRLRTNEDRKLFELSNYDKLVSSVNTAFNQVRPVVEGHRLLFLKKEILRIAKAAKEDGAATKGLVVQFEYENTEKDYQLNKNTCIEEFKQEIDSLQTLLLSIKNKCNFIENDISIIENIVSRCESSICYQMRSLNEYIITVCEKLNIDSRNIVTDFRFDKPELRLKKKVEIVEDGYWKKGKRHFYTLWLIKDEDVWVDTSYTQVVTDVSGSIRNAENYINSSTRVFNQTIQRWLKSIEITEELFFAEIQNRRSEYEARKEKSLDCQAYQQIGYELTQLAESIKPVQDNQTQVNATKTDVKDSKVFSMQLSKALLPIYRLSDNIRIKIQNEIFRVFVGNIKQHSIIGWDEYCEGKFLRYAFGIDVNPEKILLGNNVIGNSVLLIHKPVSPAQSNIIPNKGIYVLVNATQIGAAMSEISRYKVSNLIKGNNELFFVVQDFNEIMNGNSVSETLDNVLDMKRQLFINTSKVKYMLLHDNPIYNLAAVEAQSVGCTTQFDEIKILNDLQKKFNCLFPQDKSARSKVETTICIIIQKLGKI